MQARSTLKPAILKGRLAEKAAIAARIQDAEGGFAIRISLDGEDKTLGLVKEDRARVFKTFKSAKAHLAKLGIEEAHVDAPPAVPAKTRRRNVRPPRRMSKAALDAELEKALAQLDDGTAELIDCGPDIFRQIGAEIRAKYDAEGWPEPPETIDSFFLGELVAFEAIQSANIQPAEGGFRILIGYYEKEKYLGYAKEDRVRIFKTLKGAQSHLERLGIEETCIVMPPGSPAKERRRNMRPPGRMSEAAFDAELEKALAQLDDGAAELIDHGPDIYKKIHAEIRAKYDAECWPELPATIEPYLLESIVNFDEVKFACIQSAEGGFRILIGYDGKEKYVGHAKEDHPRLFKTLNDAKAHLAGFGIERYSVDEACVSGPSKKLMKQRPSLH